MGLVVKVLCGYFCIACLRPLTRRYATRRSTWRKGNGFKLNNTICSRLSGYQYDTWTRRNLHRFKHNERQAGNWV
ncbi:hypothetical protein D8T45_20645 [Vibrio vulnificus]|nr:hypothetical protein D8T45_20645 [Vibrio vulnificus]